MDIIKLNNQSNDKILKELKKNPCLIRGIDLTTERCLIAVEQMGCLLKDIPVVTKTYDICLAAVNQDGSALKHVPKKMKTEELCLAAIKSNAEAISYIPEDIITPTMYTEIIIQKGELLEYVPEKYRLKKRCTLAVKQNGLALKFVPKKLLTKELYLAAINQNGLALEYIPSRNKTKKICSIAVENNPLAIEFVPNRFRTDELYFSALKKDWKVFLFAPEKYITLENIVNLLKRILDNKDTDIASYDILENIICSLPKSINNNKKIITLERKLGLRYFKSKKYVAEKNIFTTTEYVCYESDDIIKEFINFKDFYNYVENDLYNADLYDFDFNGTDLSKINIDHVNIKSEILVANNLYDNSYYNATIGKNKKIYDSNVYMNTEDENYSLITNQEDYYYNSQNENEYVFHYISDIHIDYKLKMKFPLQATKTEIEMYIHSIVEKIIPSNSNISWNTYLLIAGDITSNFETSKIFYTELSKKWNKNIIVTLGNHELWECNKNEDFNKIIEKYQFLFNKLGIIFLYNEMLLLNKYSYKSTIIGEKDILNLSIEELQKTCLQSSTCILGGIGFSGYNSEFNASNHLYRNAIKTIDADLIQTKKFEKIYTKIKSALYKQKVIVLTHTQKENWSKDNYNSNWIYVNGHTHKNTLSYNEEKTVYSDNQIGYKNCSIGLKYFNLSNYYDIFRYYNDGKYIISRAEYLMFTRGMNISMQFNKYNGKIHMLKKSSFYCFFYESNNKLYLLKGGRTSKLKIMEIDYYYNKIDLYTYGVNLILKEYNAALKKISNKVKKFGGSGKIHGCIIDIDFFNHIYLNPSDGSVTPYYATSMIDKYTFPNVSSLLKNTSPKLFKNYCKYLEENNNEEVLNVNNIVSNKQLSSYFPNTNIYKPSRTLKSLQYLTEQHVIRNWDETILEHLSELKKEISYIEK